MTPLFFLNGVRITQEKMQQIPKESIASVEVLKGKTAIDKYGADAIGGVVLIVTK
jgi:outer membrane cobalamin receptor